MGPIRFVRTNPSLHLVLGNRPFRVLWLARAMPNVTDWKVLCLTVSRTAAMGSPTRTRDCNVRTVGPLTSDSYPDMLTIN